MRIDELPQDGNATLDGQRKAVYAQDASGTIRVVASHGWGVEETVTRQAVEEFERLEADALQRWRTGTASALEVLMYRRRMDLPLLAQAMGVWRWRVTRHLQPQRFTRLSAHWLQRYADALGIRTDDLLHPDQCPQPTAPTDE